MVWHFKKLDSVYKKRNELRPKKHQKLTGWGVKWAHTFSKCQIDLSLIPFSQCTHIIWPCLCFTRSPAYTDIWGLFKYWGKQPALMLLSFSDVNYTQSTLTSSWYRLIIINIAIIKNALIKLGSAEHGGYIATTPSLNTSLSKH